MLIEFSVEETVEHARAVVDFVAGVMQLVAVRGGHAPEVVPRVSVHGVERANEGKEPQREGVEVEQRRADDLRQRLRQKTVDGGHVQTAHANGSVREVVLFVEERVQVVLLRISVSGNDYKVQLCT